jgi:manganese transport system ATP-binding protein
VYAGAGIVTAMPAIRATQAEFRYGNHLALAAATFEIPRGAITALIGPNGSGKSTLLSGIAGLDVPVSGDIVVGGTDGHTKVAFVLQMTKVNDSLPITVREVVTMGRYPKHSLLGRLLDEDREAIDAAMQRMGVMDLENRHLRELSGGQRQRVFVAQGLAQDHDILLLDEPLTGLDLPSAMAIDAVIHEEQAAGHTIVMSTHDLAEAQVADHVLLLANRVVASGPPSEVLTGANMKEAYGPSLLHVDGDKLFLDDPAHRPVDGRHVHQDRSIHVETDRRERHGDASA